MKCNATPRDKREKHKNQRTENNSHKGKAIKHKDQEKPRQIRDTESHQLLDKESQTYFYQEVW